MKPLTPEQQAFAEEHHGLLLDFMAKHSLGDDYYDLLANRYLKVVVRYLSEEALRKYSFSTVVWYHLRSELSNYARDQVGKPQEIPIEFYCKIPAPEIAPIDDGLWRVVEDNLTYKQFEAKELQNEALSWLAEKRQESGFIFLNKYGERITTRGISGQLKKLAMKYGINPVVVYPHSFRHRFAKSFLDRCNDIAFLADLMGHESIETTRIYLRKTATEQREIVDTIVDW